MSDATGEAPRAQWGSGLGFVLAAIGAAIGFGSISRFPMQVANNGGGAFLIVYAAIMLFVGIPMLVAEFSMGRDAQKNTVGAFRVLEKTPKTKWRFSGYLFFAAGVYFLSWYSVAAGWVLKYVFASTTGAYFDAPADFLFDTFEGPDALFWHLIVMALVTFVVVGNVSKGIERLNLLLMPLLFVMIAGLVVYAATLPGGSAGYAFYLKPDFSKISVSVIAAAIGQAFFSLAVGIGSMMTYASYLPARASLAKNATIITVSTLLFATFAGLMVFPMLSAFGMLDTGQAGFGLIFGPLAQAFASLGSPWGPIVGTLFFAATFFAAFTSAVALTEPAIAYTVEEHGLDRRRAGIIVCGLTFFFGIAAAFSEELLGLEGGEVTDAVVILGALLISLYVGWWSPKAVARSRMDSGEEGWKLSWVVYPIVRYAMPAVLSVLLLLAIIGTPCGLSGGVEKLGLIQTFFGVELVGCAA